jgi:hypothetical protein
LAALALAGCSNSSSSGTTTTTSTSESATTTSSTASTSSTTPAAAVNVPVTDQIRTQLLAAGAAVNNIPVTQYSGLAPGLTYYAFDRATNTYWAGARLVPAPSSDPDNPTQAQVASQDDGAYYLFKQPRGGSWTAYPDGATGPGPDCQLTVPAPVLVVWGWPAGTCRPPGA